MSAVPLHALKTITLHLSGLALGSVLQSRFAETRFAETLTLNPNFGESGFGESGDSFQCMEWDSRHSYPGLCSASRLSLKFSYTYKTTACDATWH